MKISAYLWDRKVIIILFVVCMVFTGTIIWLTEDKSLFESNGFYAILVSLIFFAIYLTADYLRLNFHF